MLDSGINSNQYAACPDQSVVPWWIRDATSGQWSTHSGAAASVQCAGNACSTAIELSLGGSRGSLPTATLVNTSRQSPSSAIYASCPGATYFSGSGPHAWVKLIDVPDVPLIISTCDAYSDFDTDLVVWKGTGCNTLVNIACNGDVVPMSAGCQNYYSAVEVVPDADVLSGSHSLWVSVSGYRCVNVSNAHMPLYLPPWAVPYLSQIITM